MNVSSKRMAAIVVGTLLAGGLAGCVAQAYQGHMFAARNALLAARHQLRLAVPNKAGHRIAAIRAVNAALYQVDLGIRASRR